MNTKLSVLVALLICSLRLAVIAQPSAGGVVYGPKGAFNLNAPKGWVLDPTAGAEQGLPCVLYPKGDSWDTAEPLMYAKIASTDFEDAEKFVAAAIADMKQTRPGIKPTRLESGKTAGGLAYFINDYPATEAYPRHERVAYIQLPKAVAFIVYSADEEAAFQKHRGALSEAVKSLLSLEVNYPGKPKSTE